VHSQNVSEMANCSSTGSDTNEFPQTPGAFGQSDISLETGGDAVRLFL
jgi:hypothetical protein